MSDIDTGGAWVAPQSGTISYGVPTSGGTIIFGPESDSVLSDVLVVQPNTLIVISAFIPEGSSAEIYTNRIVLGRNVIPSGAACDPCKQGVTTVRRGLANILFSTRMNLGNDGTNGWTLRDSKAQIVINLPGAYQFEMSDLQDLSDIYVEYSIVQNVPLLVPTSYIAGGGF